MIVTIDGPGATGKSTIAQKLAHELGFDYFDTGAMYRCFTWYLLHHHIDMEQEEGLVFALNAFNFEVQRIDGTKHYYVDRVDVTAEIRGHAVTHSVSAVAKLPKVRHKLVHWQREWSKQHPKAIFEGRDLGSVVFPSAQVKIYLTASNQIRAERRFKEIKEKHPEDPVTFKEVLEQLKERDHRDATRATSPLVVPEGAHVVDTSEMDVDEVVNTLVGMIRS